MSTRISTRVGVRPVPKEQAHHLGVLVDRSDMECTPAIRPGCVDIGTADEKKIRNGLMAILCCKVQRRGTICVRSLDLGTVINEQLHNRIMTIECCGEEWTIRYTGIGMVQRNALLDVINDLVVFS